MAVKKRIGTGTFRAELWYSAKAWDGLGWWRFAGHSAPQPCALLTLWGRQNGKYQLYQYLDSTGIMCTLSACSSLSLEPFGYSLAVVGMLQSFPVEGAAKITPPTSSVPGCCCLCHDKCIILVLQKQMCLQKKVSPKTNVWKSLLSCQWMGVSHPGFLTAVMLLTSALSGSCWQRTFGSILQIFVDRTSITNS